MIEVTLDRPWLTLRLPRPMRVLSWAPANAGYRTTDTILWREVRNADLTPGFDAESWLAAQLPDPGAVAMLTSRDVSTFLRGEVQVDGVTAACVVTAGLSNAESVGRRLPWHPADETSAYGTINIAVVLDAALTEAAQLEALSIAVEARTAAVIESGLSLPTGTATGTGTDCVALACHPGDTRYAGLHTAVGEAVGAVVRDTMTRAMADWLAWREAKRLAPRQDDP